MALNEKVISGRLYIVGQNDRATPVPLGMSEINDWKANPDSRPSDYIVKNDGDYEVVDANAYSEKLRKEQSRQVAVSTDESGKNKLQEFVRTDKNIAVMIPSDGHTEQVPQILKSGDYLNITNKNDIYGVSAKDFAEKYHVVTPGANNKSNARETIEFDSPDLSAGKDYSL